MSSAGIDQRPGFPARSLLQILGERFSPEFAADLNQLYDSLWNQTRHGDKPRWSESLQRLEHLSAEITEFSPSLQRAGWKVRDGKLTVPAVADDIDHELRNRVVEALRTLMPWRKGPFELFGVAIDSEWRSDWKWNRLTAAIDPLDDRLVLDVGCGNGYYMWRMLEAGAAGVVGLDPTLLFAYQFEAVRTLIAETDRQSAAPPLGLVPGSLHEAAGLRQSCFDTVFSMGVLYHRRSPLDHLSRLHACLRRGGQLVLESLVIEGEAGECLLPLDRYAQMRNVWFIPTTGLLYRMLKRMQFGDIQTIDVSPTTTDEQRATDWMTFESLADGLSPNDPSKTSEGYPAPRRAIVVARR